MSTIHGQLRVFELPGDSHQLLAGIVRAGQPRRRRRLGRRSPRARQTHYGVIAVRNLLVVKAPSGSSSERPGSARSTCSSRRRRPSSCSGCEKNGDWSLLLRPSVHPSNADSHAGDVLRRSSRARVLADDHLQRRGRRRRRRPRRCEAELGGIDSFELLPAGARSADCSADVDRARARRGDRSRASSSRQCASTRRRPVVFAAERPTTELVRWALDAGIADVLSLPVTRESGDLRDREGGPRGAAQATSRAANGRVVTVFSPKGGSGKSVVATNLAVAAAAHRAEAHAADRPRPAVRRRRDHARRSRRTARCAS